MKQNAGFLERLTKFINLYPDKGKICKLLMSGIEHKISLHITLKLNDNKGTLSVPLQT